MSAVGEFDALNSTKSRWQNQTPTGLLHPNAVTCVPQHLLVFQSVYYCERK